MCVSLKIFFCLFLVFSTDRFWPQLHSPPGSEKITALKYIGWQFMATNMLTTNTSGTSFHSLALLSAVTRWLKRPFSTLKWLAIISTRASFSNSEKGVAFVLTAFSMWLVNSGKSMWVKYHPHPHPTPRDKIAAYSQMIFSNAFSWMKSFVCCLIFHWRLFLRVQLTITQHWFR